MEAAKEAWDCQSCSWLPLRLALLDLFVSTWNLPLLRETTHGHLQEVPCIAAKVLGRLWYVPSQRKEKTRTIQWPHWKFPGSCDNCGNDLGLGGLKFRHLLMITGKVRHLMTPASCYKYCKLCFAECLQDN